MLGKAGRELIDAPGRDLLVDSTQKFADLADAIDRVFARWDLSHLHEFRLPDGRRVPRTEGADHFEDIDPARDLDEMSCSIDSVGLLVGDTFRYVFDLGDGWEHTCTVLRTDADPVEEWGALPSRIVPIFGWGSIPDQYGRRNADDE